VRELKRREKGEKKENKKICDNIMEEIRGGGGRERRGEGGRG
jgi:hypothetical protein